VSTDSLAVVATGFSVFALVIVVALAVQVGRLRRAHDALLHGAAPVAQAPPDGDRPSAGSSGSAAPAGLTRVAVVRYDAFGDLAGALSFSAALLDDRGNGLVLSSINGRSETRTYAKGVSAGTGEAPLSPEEQEAVQRALVRRERHADVPRARVRA
jgi:hypothetical protein